MSDVPGRAERNRALLGLARLTCAGGRLPESADRIFAALSGAGLDPNRDSVRFGTCLERLLVSSGWSWVGRQRLGVMNLACGRAPETVTLLGVLSSVCDRIDYTGVDVRSKALDVARQRGVGLQRVFSDLMGEECRGLNVRYTVGDLSSAAFVRTLPAEQGFVLIRHQNVGFSVPVWTSIFDLALERLAPGGALVLTSHYDHEHALALNVMRALGAQCRAVERMPEPRVIGPDGKAVDRYLALFQRDEVS